MTFIELISALTGSSLSGLGLFALYKAWQNKNSPSLYVWGGWFLILLALLAWAMAGGKDRGVALGMIIIILQALSFVSYQAIQDTAPTRTNKARKTRHIKKEKKPPFVFFKTLMASLWVSLGCGILSFLTAMGLHEVFWQFGFHASNSLVIALFSFPVIWATFISLSLTSYHQKIKVTSFSGLALLNITVIALSNGII